LNKLNEKEDYFKISKNGNIHTLSDRIPLNWKEVLILPISTFLVMLFVTGWLIGLIVAIISAVGYTLYRFASWIYYSEILIDEKSGKLIRLKKILNRTQTTDLITDKFDPNRFEYSELTRSGKTKFLMKYQTHKNHELLILKNKADKELIENYIAEKITVYNTVYN
tara:strand:- start:5409 stop:5906 length:498 start_codon:yes stop_codon:yes gene_type:complete